MRRAAVRAGVWTAVAFTLISAPGVRSLSVMRASVTPGSFEFTIASADAMVTGLSFAGLQTVSSGSATLDVLYFEAVQIVLTGATIGSPCAGGRRTLTVVAAPATATLRGHIVLKATEASFTLDPIGPVSFTAASPPPPGFLLVSATLSGVNMTLVLATADGLTSGGATTTVAAC